MTYSRENGESVFRMSDQEASGLCQVMYKYAMENAQKNLSAPDPIWTDDRILLLEILQDYLTRALEYEQASKQIAAQKSYQRSVRSDAT